MPKKMLQCPPDMREFTREQGQLALTYAEDGAYHSAARVLRTAAETLEAHAQAVDRMLRGEK